MGYIIVDKNDDDMRHEMRRSMHTGDREFRYGSTMPMMRKEHDSDYEQGYRMGYRHGWEDYEDDDAHYRRARDSRGRFM